MRHAEAAPNDPHPGPPEAEVRRQPDSWLLVVAGVVVVVSVGLRLVNLHRLPGELYGDVIALLDYVGWILVGRWPTYVAQSAGPLYHYLVAPFLAVTGLNYFNAKLASVIISLGVLLATYGLARRLAGTPFALVATFVAGCSSWLLVFSRLGNSQILVPLVTTVALWLAVRAVQRGSAGDVAACAAVSTLGLYVYPQSYILSGVAGLTLVSLRPDGRRLRRRHLALFVGVSALFTVPFLAWAASRPPELSAEGYIGSKIRGEQPLATLTDNVVQAALAFWVRGDDVFRSNPPRLPHVDPVSGVFLVVGFGYWLLPRRQRKLAAAVVLPLVLLQVPSVLVLSEPTNVPSASRTLGAAPLVSIVVASGLWWMATWRGRRRGSVPDRELEAERATPSRAGLVALLIFLIVILALNVDRYFRRYARALPYSGTPVADLLARWIDRQLPTTRVYLVDCCWIYGMPEPAAVSYSLADPTRLVHLESANLRCSDLPLLDRPAVLVWSFQSELPSPRLTACAEALRPEVHRSGDDYPIFSASRVLSPPLGTFQARRRAAAREGLVLDRESFAGEAVAVLHTPFDLGSTGDLLDGRSDTVVRSTGTGGMYLELHFPVPPTAERVVLELGSVPGLHARVTAQRPDGSGASTEVDLYGPDPDPTVDIPLPTGRGPVAVLRVELTVVHTPHRSALSVHARELSLR